MAIVLLRPTSLRLVTRPCRTRLPFRFGIATMTEAPMLVAELRAETDAGPAVGYAGELLVPKWFSKDPESTIESDNEALVAAARVAFEEIRDFASTCSGATAFDLWLHAQMACVEPPEVPASARLVRTFGVSLVERAIVDAICRVRGLSFFDLLEPNELGIRFGEIEPRLAGWTGQALGKRSVSTRVRHTVGLADALEARDVEASQRDRDDHPLCLTDDIRAYGLTCFKVKVSGDAHADLARLERIATLTPEGSQFTLDGNEQYGDPAELAGMLDELEARGNAGALLAGLLAIEQPVHRRATFDPDTREGIARLAERAPVLIDEADADLSSYARARELGYGGVSMKACKGVFRALLARARIDADGEGMQSAEDLTNLPILPLHQDLSLVSALGLPHVERNGHHYFRGLDHLAPGEVEALLDAHTDLYRGGRQLFIEGGRIELGSLDLRERGGALQGGGFGYAGPIDIEHGSPAEGVPA